LTVFGSDVASVIVCVTVNALAHAAPFEL